MISAVGYGYARQILCCLSNHPYSLQGYTEITIVPANSELQTILLHSRQCSACLAQFSALQLDPNFAFTIAIHSVYVGAHTADFVHNDPIANLTAGISEPDCHRHPELKRKLYSALQEGDEGELSIAIPKEVSLKPTGSVDSVFNDCESPSFLSMNKPDLRTKSFHS